MATPIMFNGTPYSVPSLGDGIWGNNVSSYLIAISLGALQQSGGAFTLKNEVDFGDFNGNKTCGLRSVFFKSKSANFAASGVLRLAHTDLVAWRNFANNADVTLGVNASDLLEFNGVTFQPSFTLADTSTIDLDLTSDVLSAAIVSGSITNSLVSASAAIAYSKLNLAGSIVNDDIASGAAIAFSKLATGTANYTLNTNGSGVVVAEETLSSNAKDALYKSQYSAKFWNAANTFYLALRGSDSTAVNATLTLPPADGTNGQLLGTDGSGQLQWISPLVNPMTTQGDIIIGGASGAANRLGLGSANYLPISNGTTLAYGLIANANIDAAAAIAGSKISPAFSSVVTSSAATATSINHLQGHLGLGSVSAIPSWNTNIVRYIGNQSNSIALLDNNSGSVFGVYSGLYDLGAGALYSRANRNGSLLFTYDGTTSSSTAMSVRVGTAYNASAGSVASLSEILKLTFAGDLTLAGFITANNGLFVSGQTSSTTGTFSGFNIGLSSPVSSSFKVGSSVLPVQAGTANLTYNAADGVVGRSASSRLIKSNIVDFVYGLDELLLLKPRKFNYTWSGEEDVGLIAEEVEEILPEFTPKAPKSTLTGNEDDTDIVPVNVKYEKLIVLAINAIKELKQKNDELEARIAALEGV